ncbi:hypothetical protein IE53DRAFT_312067 [Violaceomyces palustris]|uniref:Uncharacterized protein n=1 Tax=Violaceomyces palustris TaxID=1673888 RepID=A0ACD0P317_9BASI|nr:hypothetical protein IE53DRAFT_312067 [Violaceomyces palustris]
MSKEKSTSASHPLPESIPSNSLNPQPLATAPAATALRPSYPLSDTTNQSSNPANQHQSKLAHKRSVRSITKQYEVSLQVKATSPILVPSAGSCSPSPSSPLESPQSFLQLLLPEHKAQAQERQGISSSGGSRISSQGSTQLVPSPSTSPVGHSGSLSHNTRSSVLLASSSYPSTLSTGSSPSLLQTASYSYVTPPQATHSVRLASPSYPSTLGSLKLIDKGRSQEEKINQFPRTDFSPATMMQASSSSGLELSLHGLERGDSQSSFKSMSSGTTESFDEENDTVADLGSQPPSSLGRSKSNGSGKDPSQMTPAERREHSRRHSRVHSRNLSVFFPRPGTDAEREADEDRAADAFLGSYRPASTHSAPITPPSHHTASSSRPHITVSTDPSTLSPRSAALAQVQASTYYTPKSTGLSPSNLDGDLSPSPTKSRRGHHHVRSVSHVAMFDGPSSNTLSPASATLFGGVSMGHASSAGSFSDGSKSPSLYATTPTYEVGDPFTSSRSPSGPDHDHQHGEKHHSHDHRPIPNKSLASLPSRFLMALSFVPRASRPLFIFGLLHFLLGASLWVSGQAVDSLAATGLGYLVVFDSMGVLSNVFAEWAEALEDRNHGITNFKGQPSIRKPYGTHRLSTLLHFIQTIYLLFSSVYVLKESIEHALLEGSAETSIAIGQGHDHAHAHEEEALGLALPTTLLALGTVACIFSNVILGNHAKLVAACGISTAASGYQSSQHLSVSARTGGHGRSGSVLVHPSVLASPLLVLLANPFSLTVLFFSTVLLFSGLTMPPLQVAALDKVLAGLESVSMFYVAYPASVALGKVLLQTAPPENVPQKVQLSRSLKTIEEHPLVSHVEPPQLWQLTPPTASVRQSTGGMLGSGAGSLRHGAKSASLIASVTIYLKPEASEKDCFEMTRWAWERLAPSLGAGRGLRAGEMLRGTIRAGELTIEVRREGHEVEDVDHGHDHHDGCHGHHHHHHHHHDDHHHDHKHDHKHDHHHDHHQDHRHDHQHHQNHDHHDHAAHHHHQDHEHSHHDHSLAHNLSHGHEPVGHAGKLHLH